MIVRTGGVAAALCFGIPAASALAASADSRETGGSRRGDAGRLAEVIPPADLEYLRGLCRAVVEAARVRPGEKRDNSPANGTGAALIMPGGHYPAYWIRDFAMSLGSGEITAAEMRHHLLVAARGQNGPFARHLKHGLRIPPFAVPDHVNFDGGAVFYPGTYSASDDQGNGAFGILPPVDDHFEFIHLAYCLYRRTQDVSFLRTEVDGFTLLDRLIKAWSVPPADPETGMVVTDDSQRAVGFGFCDSVYFTGSLLFPSLLRYRAAGQLLDLLRASGRRETQPYRAARSAIARHLARVFMDPHRLGHWLMAATQVGRQADVWGTLYALHLGLLKRSEARRTRQTVKDALDSIAYEGAVRHVPRSLDASPSSAWERALSAVDTYQNGAYWHTPTGWLIEALLPVSPELAKRVFADYISHLRRGDFRAGGQNQAPWECFGREGKAAQNGVYMTSVALPLAVLDRLIAGDRR